MNIVMLNGTMRKESTYHIGKLLIQQAAEKDDRVTEFFFPKDMPHYCIGCSQCFMEDEVKCPHYEQVAPIVKAMTEADLLVFTSPVYVYHISGQLKAFLDHLGYQWMVHRPNESMFRKQAAVITTAAGGGMKSAVKDVKDSLMYWGVGKIYTYGKAVGAIRWKDVSLKKKKAIQHKMKELAGKIKRQNGRVKVNIKSKALFYIMRFAQKKGGFNQADHLYWKKKGWLEKARPWKD